MNDLNDNSVLRALEAQDYDWRTIDGLVSATGLSADEVNAALDRLNGRIVRSSIPDKEGRALYTTREHYRATHSLGSRILNALSDKVA